MAETNKAAEYKAAIQEIADAERNGASDKKLDDLCIAAAKKFFPDSRQKINDALNDDIDAFLSGKPITRFDNQQSRSESKPEPETQPQERSQSTDIIPPKKSTFTAKPATLKNEILQDKPVQVFTYITQQNDKVDKVDEAVRPVEVAPKVRQSVLSTATAKTVLPQESKRESVRQPLPSGQHINYIEKTAYDMIAKAPDKGYTTAVNIKPDRLAAFIAESKELGDTEVQQLLEKIQARRENTK